MRIVLTIVAVELLRLPYPKLAGAGLLWIALQLLIPDEGDDDGPGETATGLGAAIKTILIADLVMSLDNVIAVAAAAKGNTPLLIIGLAISIPLVIFASRLLLTLMERYPIIITLGAALLGWVAGEMAISDPISNGTGSTATRPSLHWARRWPARSRWWLRQVAGRAQDGSPRPSRAVACGAGSRPRRGARRRAPSCCLPWTGPRTPCLRYGA